MSEPSDSAFAGYRFHRVLGDGALGGTFEATEVSSGDTVVIESLIGEDAENADLRDWFVWAWEALSEVDHRNLPQVRSVGEGDDVPFAVRDPIDGTRLPKLLTEVPSLGPQAMRILICRLADGLDRAHAAGVIHGSLGPDDLIVERQDGARATGRIVGFGRVEGRRRDDIRGLGTILEILLESDRAAQAIESGEESAAETALDADDEAAAETPSDDAPADAVADVTARSPIDTAILAMLARVADGAREGAYRSAAEFRDAVAAGTLPGGGPGLTPKVLGLIALGVVVVVVLVVLLMAALG